MMKTDKKWTWRRRKSLMILTCVLACLAIAIAGYSVWRFQTAESELSAFYDAFSSSRSIGGLLS
jgi:NADH:ubiquinone oxidoreductase subunit B-like Fe-S oxidoreductase